MRKHTKTELHHLIDKVVDYLPRWKASLMTRVSCLIMVKIDSPHCYTYVSNDCIGFPNGTGFLIFRLVEITIVLVGERHTNQALDQKDRVSSDYEPYHNPVNLAEKAYPCMRNKELMQELERKQLNEVTNGRCMINHSKLGFHNR
jgi:hypothetical protein